MSTISVIVPTWRRAESLARCLRALAAQDRAPDEVIVVTRTEDQASRAAARSVALPVAVRLLLPEVAEAGVIVAMQRGLDAATGTVIALTDDDAEPARDWIARFLAHLDGDAGIGGVGGLDRQPHEQGAAPVVGRVQWFGRVIGRHHLGAGPARGVDVLKGVNCAFRAPLLRAVGFDARLRGAGAQQHWELGVCLPLRRAGWRLIYDPAVVVAHHVEPRTGADQFHRGLFDSASLTDAVHNETLLVLEHLSPAARFAFERWAALAGTVDAPGMLNALRLRVQGHRWAWAAWRAARLGRTLARRTLAQSPPRDQATIPQVGADAATTGRPGHAGVARP
ncbi:MAG: glycosyltransferase [Gemmatimonadota bacterium]|nr:glycosyltransferase [Gemmatimonadota bacterium]